MNNAIGFHDTRKMVLEPKNHHPICFSSKVITKNVCLQIGEKHNVPLNGIVKNTT